MGTCSSCKETKQLSEFPPSKATNKGQWCRQCLRESARRRIGAVERELQCGWCDTSFRSAFAKAMYCSRPCKDKAVHAAGKQQRLEAKPERACRHCGGTLSPAMRADAAYCSEQCNSAAHKLKRGHGRLGPGRRRDIERAYIIGRDRSRCHICGEVCLPGEITLDHLIPLSKGGTHAPENLRVAHLSCNCAKRDRAANDQLMLIG